MDSTSQNDFLNAQGVEDIKGKHKEDKISLCE